MYFSWSGNCEGCHQGTCMGGWGLLMSLQIADCHLIFVPHMAEGGLESSVLPLYKGNNPTNRGSILITQLPPQTPPPKCHHIHG